jgi:hypothetical protein
VRRGASVAAGAILLGAATLLSACRAGGGSGSGALGRLGDVVEGGEAVNLVRALPPPAPAGSLAVVVTAKDGKVELRVAEPKGDRLAIVHTARPGDEFRNLDVEDVTGDGAPEVVSSWIGGQLEVVEVLGRAQAGAQAGAPGAWTQLLMNGGQEIETRRRPDRKTDFWITSRTYEESSGQPPVYQTTIYAWDGTKFREENGAP